MLTPVITRWCLRLPFLGRKVKSPGNLNYQGFLELCAQLRVTAITWPVFSASHPFHASSLFKTVGLRSVGIAVRLAKGRKAQRGWLHTARVGLTRRPAALEWSGSAEAIPAPLVMQRQGSSPRSSGLGRLCLSKPLTPGDNRSQRICETNWIGLGNRIGKVRVLLPELSVSHGSVRLAESENNARKRDYDWGCRKVRVTTLNPSNMS